MKIFEMSLRVLVRAANSYWKPFQNFANLKSFISLNTLRAVIAPLPDSVSIFN